jgi:hypothetical protein
VTVTPTAIDFNCLLLLLIQLPRGQMEELYHNGVGDNDDDDDDNNNNNNQIF